MEVLRNQDHDHAEGQPYRSYAGSDRVIPSDLPIRGFACVHHRPLFREGLTRLLDASGGGGHASTDRFRNLLLGVTLPLGFAGPPWWLPRRTAEPRRWSAPTPRGRASL